MSGLERLAQYHAQRSEAYWVRPGLSDAELNALVDVMEACDREVGEPSGHWSGQGTDRFTRRLAEIGRMGRR
jgi:hypothetical protein